MVFKRPDLIQEHELDGELKTHDLNELAKKAKVTVDQQHEQPVLVARVTRTEGTVSSA
jgi:hypothetical protein